MHNSVRNHGSVGQAVDASMSKHNARKSSRAEVVAPYEEVPEMMSLSLDGRIEANAQVQLDELLSIDAQLREEWAIWQFLDLQFRCAESMAPDPGFADRMMYRLAVAERRRKLRLGIVIAVAYLFLWGTIAVGTASLGFLLLWMQPLWLENLLLAGGIWMDSVNTWIGALGTTAMALLAIPQVRGAGLVYIAVSIVLLFGWTRVLRHSIRTGNSLRQV